MTWTLVAKKDFEDAIRSKVLWLLLVLFLLFAAGGSGVMALGFVREALGIEVLSSNTAIVALNSVATLLIPIIAIVVGYGAIVGERDSGSLKILLSLPHSRGNVVLGKLVGRTSVLAVSILVGYAAAVVVILLTYDRFEPVNFVLFTLLTLLLGLVFVSLAVGFSASMSSKDRVIISVIGFYVVLYWLWDLLLLGGFLLVSGELPVPGQNYPSWYVFLSRLSPTNAYGGVTSGFMDFGNLQNQVDLSRMLTDTDTVPFYLSKWASLAVLLLWIAVPVALGYVKFSKSDLT